jgi:hypothetical protein
MKFSNKIKLKLFVFLIILNIVLRFQVVHSEVGPDSVMVHMMANSISEFGYAKWVLHPKSFFGMYPYSEVSSVPFFISGICQSTGIGMRWVIFLYCVLLGLLSIFTAYLMAGAISDDDVFKFLAAFAFSTSPAMLGYSTWTIPARGLFIALAPLLIYLLLKYRTHIKWIPIIIFFAVFLYATHHLIYFLIPALVAFFVLLLLFKLKKHIKFIEIPAMLAQLVPLMGFAAMFSIPFFGRKFIECSVYTPIYESYARYTGMLVIPALGGLGYLIFKANKNFTEWFLLLTIIFTTALIYEQTYMKSFLPIFLILFACIGIMNVLRSERKKYARTIVSIFLLTSLSFSGYYQFLHFLPTHGINERYTEDSTYTAGRWMKECVNGSAISSDMSFGYRIAAASETTHHLVESTLLSVTYGFAEADLSQFKFYPITSENFWFDVGEMETDTGELIWDNINKLDHTSPYDFNVSYVAENTKTMGSTIWHHGRYPSKLLHHVYDNGDCVYDCGKVNLWKLSAD